MDYGYGSGLLPFVVKKIGIFIVYIEHRSWKRSITYNLTSTERISTIFPLLDRQFYEEVVGMLNVFIKFLICFFTQSY